MLLIYIQCGAGSSTADNQYFQGILTDSVFLKLSKCRAGCVVVIPRIWRHHITMVRARRPDAGQALNGHEINFLAVKRYHTFVMTMQMSRLFLLAPSLFCACAKKQIFFRMRKFLHLR